MDTLTIQKQNIHNAGKQAANNVGNFMIILTEGNLFLNDKTLVYFGHVDLNLLWPRFNSR